MNWLKVVGLLLALPLAQAETTPKLQVVKGSESKGIEVVVIWINTGGGSKTQMINPMATTQASAPPATHTVTVGGSAGLVYTPNSISANIGDMVIFQFMSNNHTATQSAFSTPCEPLAGGMDSDFMPNINNTVVPPPQMAMEVKVSTPIWFYCRQKGHCGKGMTFSINPTENKTQAMFQQMAIAQNGTGSTASIVSPPGSGTSSDVQAPPAAATMPAASMPSMGVPPAAGSIVSVAPPSSTGEIAQGSGNSGNGVCACSCFCGVGNYPSAAQGLNGFGGYSGSMPASAAMMS